MSTVIDFRLENTSISPQGPWEVIPQESSYVCYIALVREDDGTYSAIVLNLPGCGSCGDSEEEAIKNVKEAVAGCIESYASAGEQIPWAIPDRSMVAACAKYKRITVNA
jgi:predicted RNase H-like HicB family nuclease